MNNRIDKKYIDETLVEEIEEILDEINLRKKQCEGGRSQWLGERQAAMAVTHLLMQEKDMDFRDANKIGWSFVYKERENPCNLSDEEPIIKDEQQEDEKVEKVEKDDEQDDVPSQKPLVKLVEVNDSKKDE